MSRSRPHRLFAFLLLLSGSPLLAQNSLPLRLAGDPELSPDGATLLFAWGGDIWTALTAGGLARPITTGTPREREPHFSPDGKRIAFASDREGSFQLYVMDATGGAPEQITFHSAGYALEGWFPDGKSLLAVSSRDNYWDDARRFFRVHLAVGEARRQPQDGPPSSPDQSHPDAVDRRLDGLVSQDCMAKARGLDPSAS